MAKQETPKYRVKEKSFIDNHIRNEGDEIEYEGIPHRNLEPLNAEAKKMMEDPKAANLESAQRMRIAALGGDPNDPEDAGLSVMRPEGSNPE